MAIRFDYRVTYRGYYHAHLRNLLPYLQILLYFGTRNLIREVLVKGETCLLNLIERFVSFSLFLQRNPFWFLKFIKN